MASVESIHGIKTLRFLRSMCIHTKIIKDAKADASRRIQDYPIVYVAGIMWRHRSEYLSVRTDYVLLNFIYIDVLIAF